MWGVVDNFEFCNFFDCIKVENIDIVKGDLFVVSEGLVVKEIDGSVFCVMGIKNM